MSFENVADVYPLTHLQEGMLFHSISDPDSGVFIEQIACTLTGELDIERFQRSWNSLVSRHAALRTCFLWDGLDAPMQVVRESVDLPWKFFDWCQQSGIQQQTLLDDFLASDRVAGFDLAVAPLMRFTLIRLDSQTHRFVWTCHHLLADGWSIPLIFPEMLDNYSSIEGRQSANHTPFLFRDFVTYCKQQPLDQAEAFWRRQLAGFDSPNQIPDWRMGNSEKNLSPSIRSPSHTTIHSNLSHRTSQSLREFARINRLTLNTVILGAWAKIVSLHSDSTDVVFGTTVSGRPPELEGIESAIGPFINTLPLRVKLSNEPLGQWLQQIQEQQVAVRQFEFSPLAEVQRWSDVANGTAIFQSIVVFENYPEAESKDHNPMGFVVSDYRYFEQSNYPLALLIVPADDIELHFVFEKARFSQEFVHRLHLELKHVLESFVQDVESSICDPGRQLRTSKRLSWFENTKNVDIEPNKLVHDLIADQALALPKHAAVSFDDSELTYAELDAQANQLACALIDDGIEKGNHVGLLASRCPDMIVGILGILKAGAAYIPLDPSFPKAHLHYVIEDADISTVVTQKQFTNELPDGTSVIPIESIVAKALNELVEPPPVIINPEDTAYVIYTSGSTGRPKGVVVSHANLRYSTRARTIYYGADPARFLLLSSFAFDSSVAGIFWTLSTGGTLVLPRAEQEKDTRSLVELMRSKTVTHLLCLPSLYALILEEANIDFLETAIVAGEALNSRVVEAHFLAVPNTKLYNEYGPTESTVWATATEIKLPNAKSVSIGNAIPGTTIAIVDSTGQSIEHGAAGEICVGGLGVTAGYLNRGDLTEKSFLNVSCPNGNAMRMYRTGDKAFARDDGQLVFLGRIDRQIKIRGHRIEPDAVEHVLLSLDEISEAYVCTIGDRGSGHRLTAYIASDELQVQLIRQQLQSMLPGFMLPSQIVCLPELPKLPNGKIDSASLPQAASTIGSGPHVNPRTKDESTLAKIWQDTIGVTKIGVTDNFFSLGGDSIISIQVISRARQAGIELEPKHIAQYPTIEQLAAIATKNSPHSKVSQHAAGTFPLSPIQKWFFESNQPHPNHWNMSGLFELPTNYDPERLCEALRNTITAHPILNAQFQQDGKGEWRLGISGSSADSIPIERVGAKIEDQGHFEMLCLHRERSLDLNAGPLYRLVIFQNTHDGADRLLIVAHHLVIDAVSWRILIDDISHQYKSPNESLPAPTSGYGDYSLHLHQYAATPAIERQRKYWRDVLLETALLKLPFRDADKATAEANVFVETRELDSELTNQLIGSANEAFKTTPHHLLLSALTLAVTDWSKHGRAAINLESHGRTGCDLDKLDLSRTVGWTSSVYPVVFPASDEIAATIKSTKDQANRHSTIGTEFNVLKHLSDQQDRQALNQQPDVLFNYLGIEQANSRTNSLLRTVELKKQTCRAQENTREHPVEIVALIKGSVLRVSFSFCENRVETSRGETFADSFLQRLIEVVDTCSRSERSFTPTDFGDTDLSQTELDDFLDSL